MKKNAPNFFLRFCDNTWHCLASFFSTQRFSNFGFLNTVFTIFSTAKFVIWHFRFRWFMLSLASSVFSLGWYLWKYASATPHSVWGFAVPLISLFVSLAFLVGSVVWRILFAHRPEAYGPSTVNAHRLDPTYITSSAETALEKDRPHFDKVVPRHEDHPLFRTQGSNIENLIEFDRAVSSHLLGPGVHIRFPEGEPLFEVDERDILGYSRKLHNAMIRALMIKRNESITRGKSFFNTTKVSVRKLGFEQVRGQTRVVGHVGTTSYFLSAITNDIACRVILEEDATSRDDTLWKKLLPLKQIQGEDQWIPLALGELKALSNHVGSVILAVSSDGIPIFCRQNNKSQIAGGRYVLSGSGSLEYADVFDSQAHKTRSMSDFIRFGMARELLEETLDIPQGSYRRCDKKRILEFSRKIQLAGYYRDFSRGGFPIFFGFARLDVDHETLRSRKAPRICPWADAGETSIAGDNKTPVRTPDEMLAVLSNYMDSKEMPKRKVSDQVIVMKKLLEEPVVQEHLKRVLDAPAG